MRVQQSFHRHDHAGGAEAALKGLVLEKSLLHGIELAVLRETFDRQHVFAFDVGREGEAGADGFAVDQYGAGTADPDTAAFDGAFELQIVAQKFQKTLVRTNFDPLP